MMKIVQLMMLLSMWAAWPTVGQELTDKSSNTVSNPNNDSGAAQEANIQSKMTSPRQEKRSLEVISTDEDTASSQDVGSDTLSRLLFPLFSRGTAAPCKKKKRHTGCEGDDDIGHNWRGRRHSGHGFVTVPKWKRTTTMKRKTMRSMRTMTTKKRSMTMKMRSMTKKMRTMTKKKFDIDEKRRAPAAPSESTNIDERRRDPAAPSESTVIDEKRRAPAAPSESTYIDERRRAPAAAPSESIVEVPTPLLEPDVSPLALSAPSIDLAP